MVKAQRLLFLSMLFFFFKTTVAQSLYESQHGVKHRISGGVLFSFFKVDPQVTKNVAALRGFTLSYATEIPIVTTTNVLVGINYLNQGIQFNGYFLAPGYTYVFDKTFAYVHRLRYQALQLPVALKIDFNVEKDHPYTPYCMIGFGFSYLFQSTVSIVSDSTEKKIYKGKTVLTYENHSVSDKLNAFYQLGFGIQKNMRRKKRGLFLELYYRYEISRLHYEGHQNSNNVNFRNANLSVSMGLKF